MHFNIVRVSKSELGPSLNAAYTPQRPPFTEMNTSVNGETTSSDSNEENTLYQTAD